MDVLYAICCGLDVHKASVTACLRRGGRGGRVTKETRTVGTTTADLLGLCDWLVGAGCTHVAMESTGVYWKPVFNLFEGHFTQVKMGATPSTCPHSTAATVSVTRERSPGLPLRERQRDESPTVRADPVLSIAYGD